MGMAEHTGRSGAIRAVLHVGKFRSYRDLNRMTLEDQRNTLITELTGRTNQPVSYYQSLENEALAGVGAVLVFVRQANIRDDAAIKTMSDDDLRNTLITELYAQTAVRAWWVVIHPHSVPDLQSRSNLDLVLLGLGQHRSYIRGVLQLGEFRSYRDLNRMESEDERNTLITELTNRTNKPVSHYQSLDDHALAGAGAVLVFVRQAKIRDDAAIKRMSDDDLRNTLITEIAGNQVGGGHGGPALQAMSNLELVARGLTMTAWAL